MSLNIKSNASAHAANDDILRHRGSSDFSSNNLDNLRHALNDMRDALINKELALTEARQTINAYEAKYQLFYSQQQQSERDKDRRIKQLSDEVSVSSEILTALKLEKESLEESLKGALNRLQGERDEASSHIDRATKIGKEQTVAIEQLASDLRRKNLEIEDLKRINLEFNENIELLRIENAKILSLLNQSREDKDHQISEFQRNLATAAAATAAEHNELTRRVDLLATALKDEREKRDQQRTALDSEIQLNRSLSASRDRARERLQNAKGTILALQARNCRLQDSIRRESYALSLSQDAMKQWLQIQSAQDARQQRQDLIVAASTRDGRGRGRGDNNTTLTTTTAAAAAAAAAATTNSVLEGLLALGLNGRGGRGEGGRGEEDELSNHVIHANNNSHNNRHSSNITNNSNSHISHTARNGDLLSLPRQGMHNQTGLEYPNGSGRGLGGREGGLSPQSAMVLAEQIKALCYASGLENSPAAFLPLLAAIDAETIPHLDALPHNERHDYLDANGSALKSVKHQSLSEQVERLANRIGLKTGDNPSNDLSRLGQTLSNLFRNASVHGFDQESINANATDMGTNHFCVKNTTAPLAKDSGQPNKIHLGNHAGSPKSPNTTAQGPSMVGFAPPASGFAAVQDQGRGDQKEEDDIPERARKRRANQRSGSMQMTNNMTNGMANGNDVNPGASVSEHNRVISFSNLPSQFQTGQSNLSVSNDHDRNINNFNNKNNNSNNSIDNSNNISMNYSNAMDRAILGDNTTSNTSKNGVFMHEQPLSQTSINNLPNLYAESQCKQMPRGNLSHQINQMDPLHRRSAPVGFASGYSSSISSGGGGGGGEGGGGGGVGGRGTRARKRRGHRLLGSFSRGSPTRESGLGLSSLRRGCAGSSCGTSVGGCSVKASKDFLGLVLPKGGGSSRNHLHQLQHQHQRLQHNHNYNNEHNRQHLFGEKHPQSRRHYSNPDLDEDVLIVRSSEECDEDDEEEEGGSKESDGYDEGSEEEEEQDDGRQGPRFCTRSSEINFRGRRSEDGEVPNDFCSQNGVDVSARRNSYAKSSGYLCRRRHRRRRRRHTDGLRVRGGEGDDVGANRMYDNVDEDESSLSLDQSPPSNRRSEFRRRPRPTSNRMHSAANILDLVAGERGGGERGIQIQVGSRKKNSLVPCSSPTSSSWQRFSGQNERGEGGDDDVGKTYIGKGAKGETEITKGEVSTASAVERAIHDSFNTLRVMAETSARTAAEVGELSQPHHSLRQGWRNAGEMGLMDPIMVMSSMRQAAKEATLVATMEIQAQREKERVWQEEKAKEREKEEEKRNERTLSEALISPTPSSIASAAFADVVSRLQALKTPLPKDRGSPGTSLNEVSMPSTMSMSAVSCSSGCASPPLSGDFGSSSTPSHTTSMASSNPSQSLSTVSTNQLLMKHGASPLLANKKTNHTINYNMMINSKTVPNNPASGNLESIPSVSSLTSSLGDMKLGFNSLQTASFRNITAVTPNSNNAISNINRVDRSKLNPSNLMNSNSVLSIFNKANHRPYYHTPFSTSSVNSPQSVVSSVQNASSSMNSPSITINTNSTSNTESTITNNTNSNNATVSSGPNVSLTLQSLALDAFEKESQLSSVAASNSSLDVTRAWLAAYGNNASDSMTSLNPPNNAAIKKSSLENISSSSVPSFELIEQPVTDANDVPMNDSYTNSADNSNATSSINCNMNLSQLSKIRNIETDQDQANGYFLNQQHPAAVQSSNVSSLQRQFLDTKLDRAESNGSFAAGSSSHSFPGFPQQPSTNRELIAGVKGNGNFGNGSFNSTSINNGPEGSLSSTGSILVRSSTSSIASNSVQDPLSYLTARANQLSMENARLRTGLLTSQGSVS